MNKSNNKGIIWAIVICSVFIMFVTVGAVAAMGYLLNKTKEVEVVKVVDSNTIEFDESGTTIDFSKVIHGRQKVDNELIIVAQQATVSTKIEDNMIDQLDIDWLKQSQTVTYNGEGYFVINLADISEDSITQDDDKKIVTIKVNRPYLKLVDVDPEKIIVDKTKQGILTWGDLKLSVSEYNEIESEIRQRMEESLSSPANTTSAQAKGLIKVQEMYEEVVKAVDEDYSVKVEYKN